MVSAGTLAWSWTWQQWLLAALALAAGLVCLAHLLLRHRDYRSAAFWTAIIVLSPLAGAVLYALLGINFVRRRGRHYRGATGPAYREAPLSCPLSFAGDSASQQADCALAMALERISRFNFLPGNDVRPLCNGDEAMPIMLEAIRGAQKSITMASYIFEAKGVGAEFVEALTAAVRRGVQVRVMVDDAGTRYSHPPVTRVLRRAGVPVRRFMPNRFVLRLLTLNLRNHRKLLIVDGETGFTGGMNVREGNMLRRKPAHPVRDLHFQVRGPVVAQMQRVFAEDWAFCAGEILEGDLWFPSLSEAGVTNAIGVVDGPDEDLEVMPAALFAALSSARQEVLLITPYFLPPQVLMAALKLCATRGVRVTIITPAVNNIALVAWASRTLYAELLQAGCRILESPAPFDHSKILLIDGVWSCVGSTNWDPRSLRLNFEFNLLCHDRGLAARLMAIAQVKLAESTEVTLEMLAATPLTYQLRNGFARLFIPVL